MRAASWGTWVCAVIAVVLSVHSAEGGRAADVADIPFFSAPPGAVLHVTPTGNDANPCTQSSPCRSFNRAYQLARNGEEVLVGAGSYPAQTVSSDGRSSTAAIVRIRGNGGVSLPRLDNFASRVEFASMKIDQFTNRAPSRGVTYREIDSSWFDLGGGQDIAIIGGDIGPSMNTQPRIGKTQPEPPPTNVRIEGATFHDHNQSGSTHSECLQVGGVQGLVVQRSSFRNCSSTASIHVGRYDESYPSRDVVIENNLFFSNAGASTVPVGNIQYSRSEPGLVIRYNSFFGSGGYSILATVDHRPAVTPSARIYGNAAAAPGHSQPDGYRPCDSRAVYSHNVWPASCSSTDVHAQPGFDANMHLTAGSPAIDRGNPSDFPSVDFDGDSRPRGAAPDAGADER